MCVKNDRMLIQLISFLNGMILEKELVLSHSLMNLLNSINHPLSKFLIDAHIGREDLGNSFVDIGVKDGEITFLPQNAKYGDGSDEWGTNKRQSTTIGKLIRAFLLKKGLTPNDKEIEDFVNKFKAAQSNMFGEKEKTRWELFKGDDISKWYNERNYFDDGVKTSTLHRSCMRQESKQEFFTIYTAHPNISMLALIDNETDKLIGRAIIWHELTKYKEEVTYTMMDRIYSITPDIIEKFIFYAKDKGWLYKQEQNYSTYPFMLGDDEISINLVFKLDSSYEWEEIQKPYMDTFKYLYRVKNNNESVYRLTNNNSVSFSQEWTDTEGGPGIRCEYCGGEGWSECGECEGHYRSDCDDCDGTGDAKCEVCDNGEIECSTCECTGQIDCDKCSGEGIIGDMCVKCNGNGKYEMSNPQFNIDGSEPGNIIVQCVKCDGVGKNNVQECPECDGKKTHTCLDCSNGYQDCPECDGNGRSGECGECHGSGYTYCEYCDEGRYECQECN